MFECIFAVCLILFALEDGCDYDARMKKLEQKNEDLQAKFDRGHAVEEYDLAAKCSRDARIWFNSNFSSEASDKDTLLLDFTNHYNKAQNKCYIYVLYNYNLGRTSWHRSYWAADVHENNRFANYEKPIVRNCELWSNPCRTEDEFANLIRPYFSQ
jgi:uncharacterized protein YheU (UPF0270 family)